MGEAPGVRVELFEYISIATSLILSFSLARTLSNLAPVFTTGRRYWVHGLWVLGLLTYHVTLFWQLWLYGAVDSWTLAEFVLLLLGPVTLLIGVSLLVPTDPVASYRAHFEAIRVPFYGVLVAMQLQPIPLFYWAFDVPFAVHGLFIGNLVFAGIGLVGLIARNARVDGVLVCLFVLGVVSGSLAFNDHTTMIDSVEHLLE